MNRQSGQPPTYRHTPVARILVVDDDPQYRRAVRIALTARGYGVSEAADGFLALEEVRAAAFDLVLLDWRMPGMDGGETCRAIRASRPVPVIVVAAPDREAEALAAGAEAFFRKPVDAGTLLARIGAVLGRPS